MILNYTCQLQLSKSNILAYLLHGQFFYLTIKIKMSVTLKLEKVELEHNLTNFGATFSKVK